MTYVFHRQKLESRIPVAVAGDGPYVIDDQGRRYLDGSCGAGVSCLGHSNEAVRRAIQRQVGELAYAHTGFYTTRPLENLARELIKDAPAPLSKVWFSNSGSEGVESALKIARQYFVEKGAPKRRFIIGRRQGFVGSTFGALSVGGNNSRREFFAPMLVDVTRHISPCFTYRNRRADESEENYGLRTANELEAMILELGEENVAAFICETVVGATIGAVPAVQGYFQRIREICDRYGVVMILDEVMCGMGRTGTRYACEQEGVAPDLLVVAKGLASGYQPISAVLVSQTIYDAYSEGSGLLRHGGTYQGHATACAAALAVQAEIRSRDLLANVRRQGDALRDALVERFSDHPHVGDIRGRGLLRAIELVRDRASKEPFDPKTRLAARIKKRALEMGLMCYPQGGTIDGTRGDHVMLLPPFIVESRHITEMVEKLGAAIESVLDED